MLHIHQEHEKCLMDGIVAGAKWQSLELLHFPCSCHRFATHGNETCDVLTFSKQKYEQKHYFGLLR